MFLVQLVHCAAQHVASSSLSLKPFGFSMLTSSLVSSSLGSGLVKRSAKTFELFNTSTLAFLTLSDFDLGSFSQLRILKVKGGFVLLKRWFIVSISLFDHPVIQR